MTSNNLCSSCTNIGCEFQSGIVRTKCAFYMPPHIEPDNCGNYVIMQPTAASEGGDQMAAKKKVDYTEEINIDKPIERGTELVPVGRLETQDAYLLDILKEQGFYLMYNKKETKFGELEYWQVLYPKED